MPLATPNISVIVPVYNKAPFLADCLESILAQSLKSLEVICVDDASTDGSGEILKQYAGRDGRVKVIHHNRNKGAAAARNTGLAAATGEFVQFTDADDLLPKNAVKLLLEKAQADKVDVVRGGIVGFRTETPEKLEPLDAPEARSRIRPLDHQAFWIPWWHPTYLFSRNFLISEEITYPELCSGEDPVFLAKVLTRVPLMSTISTVTYHYRFASLSQKGRVTYPHVRDYLSHAERVRDLFLKDHPDAWYRGYARLLLRDLHPMVEEWPMTPLERAFARAEMQRIFELPALGLQAQPHRRLLFMYDFCGLGGVETSIINKIEALRSWGVEVRALFGSYWGEGGKITAMQPGFRVEGEEKARRRWIREWAPDAVVVIESLSLVDEVRQAGLQCPVLFESHRSDYQDFDRSEWDGLQEHGVSAFVVPSEFNRAFLLKCGVDPDRIRVIPNALDLDRFQPGLDTGPLERLGLPSGQRFVLFVGRLEPQKNGLEFVRVCAELSKHDKSIHYVMLGDEVDAEEYAVAVRAEAGPIGKRMTFIERIAYDDMPLLYNSVAASGGCLLVTSRHESQPMVVLEAMACECPVVASDVGGMREIVQDGQTGHLYQPGDVQGAVTAVLKLLEEPEYRAVIAKAAMDYVYERRAPARAAEAYVAILDVVAAPGASSGKPDAGAATNAQTINGANCDGEPTASQANEASLQRSLTALFGENGLVVGRRTVAAYSDLVPRVRLGFEASATVAVEVHPKDKPLLSPDPCINTVILDYKVPSRWLTIEAAFNWAELEGATQYQIGLYARSSRRLHCWVVLRVSGDKGSFKDFRLCDLRLAPNTHWAQARGWLQLPLLSPLEESNSPKLLFFFDAHTDLRLELDYITIRFG